ncbi:MAG: transcription elongation factor GreA [Chloroflexota bacterium]
MTKDKTHSLGQAVATYLTTLPPEQREGVQPQLNSFVRWYGWEHPLATLTIPEVASYAERTGSSLAELRRLEMIRDFLTFAKKQKLTSINLAVHLKPKKVGSKRATGREITHTSLTPQGYAQLQAEMEGLKQQRQQLVQAVQLARADRDFKENAPLDAAREEQAKAEARIREIETILAGAKIVGAGNQISKVAIGSRVTIKDLASAAVAHYQVVHPQEVNPSQGKISLASPLGKALLNRWQGEEVEITTPGGNHRFIIEEVRDSG